MQLSLNTEFLVKQNNITNQNMHVLWNFKQRYYSSYKLNNHNDNTIHINFIKYFRSELMLSQLPLFSKAIQKRNRRPFCHDLCLAPPPLPKLSIRLRRLYVVYKTATHVSYRGVHSKESMKTLRFIYSHVNKNLPK